MSYPDEDIIQRFSHRPQHLLDGVISTSNIPPLTSTPIERKCHSSLGQLEVLPLELLYECFAYLDTQALQRMSRVNLRGNEVVNSFPQLKKIRTIVGEPLQVLARARILHLHSVNTLYAALESEKCISCGAYGPFLHLTLAVRCCLPCLESNQSLWMTSIPNVKACFGLTGADLNRLYAMQSIPGQYQTATIGLLCSRKRSVRLTSVAAGKHLALERFGSLERLEAMHPKLDFYSEYCRLYACYREAPLEYYAHDPYRPNAVVDRAHDPYPGMGAVHFPSLIGGRLEQGLWCKECELANVDQHFGRLGVLLASSLFTPGYHATRYMLEQLKRRAWTEAAFLEHVKTYHPQGGLLTQTTTGVAAAT